MREGIWIVFAVFLLLVCGLVWCVSAMWLTEPQIGPCAPGGVHFDTYLALANYLRTLIGLDLLFGYLAVVAWIFVGTVQNHRKERLGKFLTFAIAVWIVSVVLLGWYVVSRLQLCV